MPSHETLPSSSDCNKVLYSTNQTIVYYGIVWCSHYCHRGKQAITGIENDEPHRAIGLTSRANCRFGFMLPSNTITFITYRHINLHSVSFLVASSQNLIHQSTSQAKETSTCATKENHSVWRPQNLLAARTSLYLSRRKLDCVVTMIMVAVVASQAWAFNYA